MTGFTDAEGCFSLQIRNRNNSWYVEARFDISLHKNERDLMKQIQYYFGGVGGISVHGKDSIRYTVSSIEQINNKILPHFDKYPLLTQKFSDYILFKEAVSLINSKKDMKKEEFLVKIVEIKASMNRGLLEGSELKINFPNIVPVTRPIVKSQILTPY